MSVRRLLIDTDTASDDAVALLMALRSPAVEVVAITTVAGNVAVEQASRNALYVTELCGSDVPVHQGAAGPLSRKLELAHWFHGCDGLGDHGFCPARRSPEQEHAVDALLRIAKAHPGVEIITLGPLTNLAAALKRWPDLAGQVARCVIMGGAPCCEGNVTPAAEFNIWVDPEAAQIVFNSGLPIEMIGWHLCRGPAAVNPAEIERLLNLHTPFADFAIQCNTTAVEAYHTQTGEHGISLPDPVAMSVLLEPKLKTVVSRHRVQVETTSELTRGMTVVDRLNVALDARNRPVWMHSAKTIAEICWAIDVPGWKAALLRALS